MSDPSIFALGCAVSFIALAGAYVYLREGFARAARQQRPRPQPVETRARAEGAATERAA